MNFDLQQAIQLLKDLLWLKTSTASGSDKAKIDDILEELLDDAFQDVARLMADWARDVRERAARILQAQEQAALDLVAAEEQAALDLVQEERDQIEREERQRAGVS